MEKGFYVESDRTFSLVVTFPFSKFFFTHHVDPIIEEVESNVEVDSDSMVVLFMILHPFVPMFICLNWS